MVDKVRVTPLSEDERILINTLSPEERKQALLVVARKKTQRALQGDSQAQDQGKKKGD